MTAASSECMNTGKRMAAKCQWTRAQGDAGNILPWTEPFENLSTRGHLPKSQSQFFDLDRRNAVYRLSFFLELLAKGYVLLCGLLCFLSLAPSPRIGSRDTRREKERGIANGFGEVYRTHVLVEMHRCLWRMVLVLFCIHVKVLASKKLESVALQESSGVVKHSEVEMPGCL